MHRLRTSLLIAVLAGAGVLSAASSVMAAPATSIVGKWTGRLPSSSGTPNSGQRFTVVVNRGERAGTWQIGSRCAGTFRLKDISGGYHHYYRVVGAHARCAPAGVDCLQRDGARMVDVFVPNAGGADVTIKFRRVA